MAEFTHPNSIFPIDPTLEECRAAIKGAPGFRELIKKDCTVFSYDFAFKGSFPDPNLAKTPEERRLLLIRRECRGIIFHTETGKLVSRRFHKFFNVNELPETAEEKINAKRPHWVLDKMDGCLMSPLYTENQIRWATKSGPTEVSSNLEAEFIPQSGIDFNGFAKEWMDKGYTPLFEWCSYKQQIVLQYEKDMLTLTAMRHNSTGNYMTYSDLTTAAEKFKVPVTKTLPLDTSAESDTITQLLKRIKSEAFVEGYVVVFENGEMYKCKTEWYFERSKKIAGSFTGQEKELWALILDQKVDDLGDALGQRRRDQLDEFGAKLMAALERTAAKVTAVVKDARDRKLEKKNLVAELKSRLEKNDPTIIRELIGMYYELFDNENKTAYELVIKYVRENLENRNKLNKMRHAVAEGLVIQLA